MSYYCYLSEIELAYTAGIIDGEGSIQIDRRSDKNFGATVTISMKNPAVLVWVSDRYGGNIHRYKQSIGSFNKEGFMYRWGIHGLQAQEFISAIRPYLVEKAMRADVLLSFPVGSQRGAELDIQEAAYHTMKVLQDKPNRGNRRKP
ncbi:hypothetical protein LCGC14_1769410 [marine sediment metagenome]|uniref:Homing endonuclease LAGLIDADG domain-containing protein n=1 Tax=marine sediment metagenome TaxID=412755 RepID=A0A0F9GYP3_9ZZZZ